MTSPGSAFSAQETPATAANNESECIPGAIVVRGEDRYILSEQHDHQVDGSYDPVPEPGPESKGMTGEATVCEPVVCAA